MSSKQKILLLGGSYAQIPAVQVAKKHNLHVILCDYLSDNPGQHYADEFYEVSTTDKEAVLGIAKKLNVNYVMAYASDPAAPTAAYVSDELGLPGSSYESVKTLSEKDLFRKMLSEHGFNTPKAISVKKNEIDDATLGMLQLPLIVKPVDSSGSKGVTKISSPFELNAAAEKAFQFSRADRIIIEEFIDNSQGDLHGDGLVVDGELAFVHLGDHLYGSESNPYNPTGTIWPSRLEKSRVIEAEKEASRAIKASGYKNGLVNIEARIDKHGELYIMEIGARSGGHFVPQAIMHSTGLDMVDAAIKAMIGLPVQPKKRYVKTVSYHTIYSDKFGRLESIKFSEEIKTYIKEKNIYTATGREVHEFSGASSALGVIILAFERNSDRPKSIKNISNHIIVEVS